MRYSALMVLCGFLMLLTSCETDAPNTTTDNQEKEKEAKCELTLNVVDSKDCFINNFIDDYNYEYFSVADPQWMEFYWESIKQSNTILREVKAEGLFNLTGIENLGDIEQGSWRQTDRCEALWKVELLYREVSVEVVNGLGKVVCRYKRRDNFSRMCTFIGYRKRETVIAGQEIYEYSPIAETEVPEHCRNKRNSVGYYDSHESYKNENGEEAFVNICEYIDDDYVFDYYSLNTPVSYVPPTPPTLESGQSGGGEQGDETINSRPYKYVKSVEAYTVYSDLDVDKTTLYIYKGADGNRASWFYSASGLAYSATETIRSGNATIDGKSYSHYISAFGVQTYFNY